MLFSQVFDDSELFLIHIWKYTVVFLEVLSTLQEKK